MSRQCGGEMKRCAGGRKGTMNKTVEGSQEAINAGGQMKNNTQAIM